MKSNSGREKAPTPKAVMMFKGIKGLVGSGAGTTKTASIKKIRPEGAVHIDAGNLKPASGKAGKAAGSPKDLSMGSGDSGTMPKIRPEGATKRDGSGVVKPN
jgi:hypothetical protein